MNSIPTNRYLEAKALGGPLKEVVVVAAVPAPARQDFLPGQITQVESLLSVDVWDEIDGQPDTMRTLENSRFRRAFFEQVSLPNRVAVCLEDFEAGLREAGFISGDQLLVQARYDQRKFRVQKAHVVVDRHDVVTPLEVRGRKRAQF